MEYYSHYIGGPIELFRRNMKTKPNKINIDMRPTFNKIKASKVPIDLTPLMWHEEKIGIDNDLFRFRDINQVEISNRYDGGIELIYGILNIKNKKYFKNDYKKLFEFMEKDCKKIVLDINNGYFRFEMSQYAYLTMREQIDFNYVKGLYETKTQFIIHRTIRPLMLFMLIQKKGLMKHTTGWFPKFIVYMIAEYIDPTCKTTICHDRRQCKMKLQCKKYHSKNDISFFEKQLINIDNRCKKGIDCDYGINCIYFHTDEEKSFFSKLCRCRTKCKFGLKCKYIHNKADRLFFKENKVYHCKFGFNCIKKTSCNFYHTKEELIHFTN